MSAAATLSNRLHEGPLAHLLPKWRGVQRAFNQRVLRERVLMLCVGLVLALALADSLLVGPALSAYTSAKTKLRQAQDGQKRLLVDAKQFGLQASTQAELRRAEIAAWRQRTREGEALLRNHEDSLVGPDQMLELLEQMLSRHGQVRVRAMRSLDRIDLLADPSGPAGAAQGTLAALRAAAASAAAQAASAPANASANGNANGRTADKSGGTPGGQSLYRHGVELVLEGGYTDLLAYVQTLEAMPQHVLWGGMSLKVQQHPTSQLTLRLYTVSRDRHWMEI